MPYRRSTVGNQGGEGRPAKQAADEAAHLFQGRDQGFDPEEYRRECIRSNIEDFVTANGVLYTLRGPVLEMRAKLAELDAKLRREFAAGTCPSPMVSPIRGELLTGVIIGSVWYVIIVSLR